MIEPNFLGFSMNRLAAEGDPLGDAYCVFTFLVLVWFFSDVVVLGLDFLFVRI